MTRDKIHMEQVKRWAEFVRSSPRSKWKRYIDVLINAQYEKADQFYKNLEKSEKGRKILERLKRERLGMTGKDFDKHVAECKGSRYVPSKKAA